MWLVPSPFTPTKTIVEPLFVPGVPDTVKIPAPVISNILPAYPHIVDVKEDTTHDIYIPTLAEFEVKENRQDAYIAFRNTVYSYVENDTLKLTGYVEYNVQPKAMEQITLHDTLKVPTPVPIEIPFYEKPAVVAGSTAGIILLILLAL